MKVFWSWQSDTPPDCGNWFVREALKLALKEISATYMLDEAARPKVDHDTQGVDGWVDIVSTIFQKIDDAAVFIADVTPTLTSTSGKRSPNPNVLIELGYALKTLGPEAIVLVWNSASGAKPEELPFDIRHRRGPVSYCLEEAGGAAEKKEKRKLADTFKEILAPALTRALGIRDAALSFDVFPCRDGDPSIWTRRGDPLVGHELYLSPGWKTFDVVESTRSYVRLVPYGWKNGIPSRDRVKSICDDSQMMAPLFRLADESAGWATNQHGVISIYDGDLPIPQTSSATQWFDNTGEVWTFDAGVIKVDAGLYRLDGKYVLRDWHTFLKNIFEFYDTASKEFPIAFPLRVELGVSHIKNMCWEECAPDIGAFISRPKGGFAKLDHFTTTDFLRSFDPAVLDTFICASYNKLRETFEQEPLTRDEILLLVK
jgi:hypothetical protein